MAHRGSLGNRPETRHPSKMPQFRQKPVAHGVHLAQGRLTARSLVRQPDAVMDFHDIVADAMHGVGMTPDACPFIFHDALTFGRWVSEDARAIPEVEEKEPHPVSGAGGLFP